MTEKTDEKKEMQSNPVARTMGDTLQTSLKLLDDVITKLIRAVDADKGLSAQLCVKELGDVRAQQERILTAMAEYDSRLAALERRMDTAAQKIAPLLKQQG